MAIKVGGTTVINDSRVLQNVSGLKTVNSTSLLGSGNISIDSGPSIGTTKTYIGAATGSGSGSSTVSCSSGDWYAVSCYVDNQGGPASGTVGSGGITFSEMYGFTDGTIDEHNCPLRQAEAILFYAVSTTTVSISSTRGGYKVYRLS